MNDILDLNFDDEAYTKMPIIKPEEECRSSNMGDNPHDICGEPPFI